MGKLVLVDDSKVARTLLKNILESVGHEILAEGSNGMEGFDLYREHKPDAMSLDITMPVQNGIECLRNIMKYYPDAKVIMVTSVGKETLVNEAISSGAKAFLVKPLDEFDVIATLESVLYIA